MITLDNRLYNLLSLSLALGAGNARALELYEALSSSGDIGLPFERFCESSLLSPRIKARLNSPDALKTEEVLDDCRKYGITVLPVYDNAFPERLRNIPAPPLVLYIKGNLPDIDNSPVICIVGPRRVTKFGEKASFSLARRLSKAGMPVVSGTAAGADYAAHAGAVSANGVSVMVSAEGIITQISSRNRELCEKVLKHGCIISENPPRAGAGKYSFPVRNRLLSGLSVGVVVIEAPQRSGALITAGHALEQGRDVFVIPGSLDNSNYKGSNALLRDGAIPLIDTYDIFSRYVIDFPDKIDLEKAFKKENSEEKPQKNLQKNLLSGLSKNALLVYNSLDKPEFTVDDLSALDIGGAELLSALTELEIEHLVLSAPGGIYKKKSN